MADQVLAPINPNLGPQAEAMSGAQGVIFTATDRQMIKERSGEVDPTKTFKEVFFKKDLTPKVENEQSTINPEMDLRAMESRRREHRRMLKYSALSNPQEHVELSDGAQEEEVIISPVAVADPAPTAPVTPETAEEKTEASSKVETEQAASAAAPAQAFDQIAEEQKKLESVVSKIKDLHFKRLLCTDLEEFERLTVEIKNETLAAERPEARSYLEPKIDRLTRITAEYKLKFVKSLKSMHYDERQNKAARWLQKIIDQYSEKEKA